MAERNDSSGRTNLVDNREEDQVTEGPVPVRTGRSEERGAEAADGPVPAAPDAAGEASEVARLQQERDRYYDRLLRQAAEFENYRKRIERERRDQAEFAAADVLRGLLPVMDNLERALAAPAAPEADAYRTGVEIIQRQMLDLLRKHGATPIEAVGTPFDPNWHEAVLHEPSTDHADGEVIEELQRGYRLGDRLLRPSMVKVAKA